MSTSHLPQDDKPMSVLYEASYTGNVSILNSLIQQNPLILFKISQTSFTETPLHISALLGHVDFTKALLSHNPKLALELNSSRSTPLHVASAEGHVDVVKELLKANIQVCLVPNEEGRIPLHYAAMRGRTEVVKELVRVKGESLSFHDINGKSVFHLCVIYNHLETLKALVELDLDINGELLNFTSSDKDGGNTILHLAIMFKQVQTVKYLLSNSRMREATSNTKNEMGFTVHDILDRSPKDYKVVEIQVMLMNAGIIKPSENNGIMDIDQHPSTTTTDIVDDDIEDAINIRPKKDNFCTTILKFICWCCRKTVNHIGNFFKHDEKSLKDMRGYLSLVATVITSITFQGLTSPPSPRPSFFTTSTIDTHQQDYSSPSSLPSSIIDILQEVAHLFYLFCNAISFFLSLGVTLLLVSGLPLKNKVVIYIISIAMCLTVTFLALACVNAVILIVPRDLWYQYVAILPPFCLWDALLALVSLSIIIRFSIWTVKNCVKLIRWLKSLSRRARKDNHHRRCCCCI